MKLDEIKEAPPATPEEAANNRIEYLENEVEMLTTTRDAAYLDRNLVVALLARFCSTNQWPTWTAPADDAEPGFSRVVFIETPEGQISYHYPDELEPLFAPVPVRGNPYDGHSTEEKRERLKAVIHAFDDNLRRAQEQVMRERAKGSS